MNPQYRQQLYQEVPLYTTRLVREKAFPFDERGKINTPEAARSLLAPLFDGRDTEAFVVLLLDTAHTPIGLSIVSNGGLSASIVEPRQVFKLAVLSNAAALIIAHNHPSGSPDPSQEDVSLTRRLVEAGKIIGIPIIDHMIFAEDRYVSFRECDMMPSTP
jgi:DNA repair protein RadC